jgi:protein TonB
MKTEKGTSSTWEDLVFEQRNKAYGAFAIRKSYSRSLSEAACVSMLVVGLVLLGPRLISLIMGQKSDLSTAPVDIDKLVRPGIIPIIEPLKSVEPVVHKKSNVDLPPLVTTDLVPDYVAPPTELSSSGTETSGSESLPAEGWVGMTGVETVDPSPPPSIADRAEVMPSYEGGLKAMMKFIQKNMKYPNSARQMGIEGRVFVKFVVNFEGKVVNVEIVKGISEECDKEAARVIAMMPNWTPGMQDSMPVSVRMVLPINFKLEN